MASERRLGLGGGQVLRAARNNLVLRNPFTELVGGPLATAGAQRLELHEHRLRDARRRLVLSPTAVATGTSDPKRGYGYQGETQQNRRRETRSQHAAQTGRGEREAELQTHEHSVLDLEPVAGHDLHRGPARRSAVLLRGRGLERRLRDE